MLTFIETLYYLLQSWGLWQRLMAIHEAKIKAQAVANAPETKQELIRILKEDKL